MLYVYVLFAVGYISTSTSSTCRSWSICSCFVHCFPSQFIASLLLLFNHFNFCKLVRNFVLFKTCIKNIRYRSSSCWKLVHSIRVHEELLRNHTRNRIQIRSSKMSYRLPRRNLLQFTSYIIQEANLWFDTTYEYSQSIQSAAT